MMRIGDSLVASLALLLAGRRPRPATAAPPPGGAASGRNRREAAPAPPGCEPDASAVPRAAAGAAGLSWEDADELARTVTRMERRLRTGRAPADEPLVVTERQLNSYVNLSLAGLLPAGVSGLQLRLLKDRLGAEAQVDLDRVKGGCRRALAGHARLS